MRTAAQNVISSFASWAAVAWVLVGATLAGILIDALVLQVLWGWFVTPTFDLAPLTVPVAGGLVAIVMLLKRTTGSQSSEKKREEEKKDSKADAADMRRSLEGLRASLLDIFLHPLLVLTAGWLLKVLM